MIGQDELLPRLIPLLLGRLYLEQRIEVKHIEHHGPVAVARVEIAPHHERSQLGVIVCTPETLATALSSWKEHHPSLATVPLSMVEI